MKKNTKKFITCTLCMLLVLGLLFSLTACGTQSADGSDSEIQSIADLSGANVGVLTGSVFDTLAEEAIPGCNVQYFKATADLPLALQEGKVEAYIVDEPVARIYGTQYTNQKILGKIRSDEYAYIFKKNNANGTKLCNQMNEFLATSKENGLLDQIDAKWFGTDEAAKTIDYSQVSDGENGILVFATAATMEPFEYIKDGIVVGYDVDIAVEFCKAYGYGIKVENYNFSAVLSTVQSEISDFAGACITITPERQESMLFSDPNYIGGTVVVVNSTAQAAGGNGFFGTLIESFTKTFIKENRWQLFVQGIGVTVLIALMAIVCGSLLGFGLYLCVRKGNPIFNAIVRLLKTLVHGMPEVVLLMILYYLVLGSLGVSNLWVSIICFTLIFAGNVLGTLQSAVGAIDQGQYEAAFVLGYGDTKGFLRIIFPQAAAHFLPVFREEVISLLKATAIVGYIAVSDLTMVSDIVRSRTYEAFFPLIATAILYFVLEGILIFLVSRIQIGVDFKKRTPEKILKGVHTK